MKAGSLKKSSHAEFLGLMGLIPFLGLPIFTLLEAISLYEGLSFFSQYSAIILSFLGGVIWFDGITNQKSIWQLYIAMLPSIIGWISLIILPPKICIIILMVSFLALLVLEQKSLTSALWYFRLRVRLTTMAIGGHLMMIWLIYNV